MLERKTACDLIVEDIENQIINEKYKTGDKLPGERELSKEYGISRIPIREALRVLREKGLVETIHGKGTFITGVNSNILSDQITSHLLMQNNTVLEVIQLRTLLESEAARLAAINRTEEEMDKIELYKNEAEISIGLFKLGKSNTFLKDDRNFHLAIAEAAHNTLFVNFITEIHETLRIHQLISLNETVQRDEVGSYHEKIYLAIKEKDSVKAKNMMAKHMDRVKELIQKNIEKNSVLGKG